MLQADTQPESCFLYFECIGSVSAVYILIIPELVGIIHVLFIVLVAVCFDKTFKIRTGLSHNDFQPGFYFLIFKKWLNKIRLQRVLPVLCLAVIDNITVRRYLVIHQAV